MPALVWDKPGERLFEGGIDKAVLYGSNGEVVVWNGLISVTEKATGGPGTPLYFDGVKYGDSIVSGDYTATIKAYTYPDELLEYEGTQLVNNGLYVAHQEPKRFSLSYRTRVGNDEEGEQLGYKIHVIYNLLAFPAARAYESFTGANPSTFDWDVVAVPEVIDGYLPTAHLIFDTRKMGPLLITDIERALYGDEFFTAELPPIETFVTFIGGWVILRITDNLDGTWTATGPDEYFTMLDATTFQINPANAIYLGADLYAVSDTTY